MSVNNPDGGSSGATVIPGDTIANPAAIPESLAFGMLWDNAQNLWVRARALAGNGDGPGILQAQPPAPITQTATAAANTAVTITLANPGGGLARVVVGVSVSWSGAAATTGLLTMNNGANVWAADVPLALNTPFAPPLPPGGVSGGGGNTFTITLAAGGAGAIGKLNVSYYTH